MAFCEKCGRIVTRAYALDQLPCPNCGGKDYFYETPMERVGSDGKTITVNVYESTRSIMKYSDAYFSALTSMRGIHKTNMTRADFLRYTAFGEKCVEVLPKAIEEWKLNDKHAHLRFELPPDIPCATELPDMYMRWGMWDAAISVYERCASSGAISKSDRNECIKYCKGFRDCANAINAVLASHSGAMKQDDLKKCLLKYDRDYINWVLRYYKGIKREKCGSSYMVTSFDMSRL